MASSLGDLVVRLGLDAADYTGGLVKAEAQAAKFADTSTQAFRSITKGADESRKSLDYLREGFRGVIAAFGLREISRLSDEYQSVAARIKIVTATTDEAARVQSTLLGISNQTRTSFETTANLFYRISQAALDLGTPQKQVLELTEKLNKALIVSGATGNTAKGALEQLAQALAANSLRGQEFNTVNEQANRIMLALADGLGVTIGELRHLSQGQGGISTETFISGFLKGAQKIDQEFSQIPTTIGQAFTVAENKLQAFIGRLNEGAVGTAVFSKVLLTIADNLGAVTTAALTFVAVKLGNKFQDFTNATLKSVEASIAATAATRANAAAEVQALSAKLESLTATEAIIVAARAQTQTELTLTNALIAKGQVNHAFAAASIAELAALGKAQYDVGRKIALTELELAQAQKSMTALTASTSLFSRTITFLGGPIGAVITVLGALVTAWQLFGSTAEEENAKAARSTEAATKDILENLRKQNDRLAERLRLAKAGNTELAANPTPAGEQAAKLLQEAQALRETNNIDRLNDTLIGKGLSLVIPLEFTLGPEAQAQLESLTEDERKILEKRFEFPSTGTVEEQAARREAAARSLSSELSRGTQNAAELEQILGKKTIEEALRDYATQAEKAEHAIDEMKKKLNVPANQTLAQAFPGGKGAELERRIREKFTQKGSKDDPAKRILEGTINEIEAQIAREKDLLRASEDAIKDAAHDGYLSVAQSFDLIQEARDKQLQNTLSFYDQEIAAAQGFAARSGATAQERQDAENRIAAVRAKQVNILRDAGFAEQALNRERRRDLESYKDTLDEVNAKILELTGNTAEAARIRFEAQNRTFNRQLEATIDPNKKRILDDLIAQKEKQLEVLLATKETVKAQTALADSVADTRQELDNFPETTIKVSVAGNLDAEIRDVKRELKDLQDQSDLIGKSQTARRQNEELKQQAIVVGRLNDQYKNYSIVLGEVQLAQDAINFERQLGNIGEFTQLQQLSEANQKRIGELRELADLYAEIAKQSKDPADLLKAKQLQQAVEQLSKQTDLLKDKFNNILGDAFANHLEALVNGVESFKDAIKGFGRDVNAQIVKGIAEEFKAKLFGQQGPLSGIGDFLAKLLGKGFGGKAGVIGENPNDTDPLGTFLKQLGLVNVQEAASTQAVTTSQFTLVTANEAAVVALTSMTTAAASAAAALAAVTTSSTASSIGSLASTGFNLGSAFQGPQFGYAANGTDFAFGGMTWVGERGPELVNLPRGSQVVPNDQIAKWSSTNGRAATQLFQTIVLPGANTQTARQASKISADRMSYARRRG